MSFNTIKPYICKPCLRIFFLFAFGLLICRASADENVLVQVKFESQGITNVIFGEKTREGYRFNSASEKIINMATLDWPPYIGTTICNKGWVFQLAVGLLVSKGYQVNINFYPWARAVALVELGNMDILFPEYFIEETAPSDNVANTKRRELLSLSNEFPGGSVGFLKRKGELDGFGGNLKNLIGEKIGVVRGYQNTPEFDAMMDTQQFAIFNAINEVQLMRLLVAKRVNLIVGDPLVFRHSVISSDMSEQEKTVLLNGVEDVEPSLQYNYLYFAVSKNTTNWQTIIADLNMALAEFEQNGETERIIKIGGNCTNL